MSYWEGLGCMMLMLLTGVERITIYLVGKVRKLSPFLKKESPTISLKEGKALLPIVSSEKELKGETYALVVKEEEALVVNVPAIVWPLLKEFKEIALDDLPDGLLPMHDI